MWTMFLEQLIVGLRTTPVTTIPNEQSDFAMECLIHHPQRSERRYIIFEKLDRLAGPGMVTSMQGSWWIWSTPKIQYKVSLLRAAGSRHAWGWSIFALQASPPALGFLGSLSRVCKERFFITQPAGCHRQSKQTNNQTDKILCVVSIAVVYPAL